jgi:hypothetical protein
MGLEQFGLLISIPMAITKSISGTLIYGVGSGGVMNKHKRNCLIIATVFFIISGILTLTIVHANVADDIAQDCIDRWGSNSGMVEYCFTTQLVAAYKFSAYYLPYHDMMMVDFHRMEDEIEKDPVNKMAEIYLNHPIGAIISECYNIWGDNYDMLVFCCDCYSGVYTDPQEKREE